MVQADLFMSLPSYNTVEGDNVHLITADNCDAEIPADTRVLLVKRDACDSLGELEILSNFPSLERIGFGENTMASAVIFSIMSPCRSSSSA